MRQNQGPVTGLVLTGGGARAAYQAGVLQALCELEPEPSPFQVIAGASAGALNGAAVAMHADDIRPGVARLVGTWSSLSIDQVYRTDLASLLTISAHWARQLSAGGWLGAAKVHSLLDTQPLRQLLESTLDMSAIRDHIEEGRLRGVAVTATSYHSGTAVTFFDGAPEIAPWVRSNRLGMRAPLTVAHVLASGAIPMFFPPVALEEGWFGDGCIRLSAPLSPAIRLGAQRILAIGIRYLRTVTETMALNSPLARPHPSISDISGVLLNAMFLDSLDSDTERFERINATLSHLTAEQRAQLKHPLRRIPLLVLRPTRDLGSLAIEQYRRFPKTLRHLLRGIGASGDTGWDLVSYLAFEPTYIARLIELGYEDTYARRYLVREFFATEPPE